MYGHHSALVRTTITYVAESIEAGLGGEISESTNILLLNYRLSQWYYIFVSATV